METFPLDRRWIPESDFKGLIYKLKATANYDDFTCSETTYRLNPSLHGRASQLTMKLQVLHGSCPTKGFSGYWFKIS